MTKVQAPNRAYNGVVAGVQFTDGAGDFDPKANPAAARYFERHGYRVGSRGGSSSAGEAAPAALTSLERDATSESTDARDHAQPEAIGTRLRDAAVDPEPSDFLPPINAGEADPHGPRVVAPEVHHDGPKGLRPGEVHVGEPKEQEADESALAEEVLIERVPKDEVIATFDPEESDTGPLGLSDPGSARAARRGGSAGAERPSDRARKQEWVEYAVSSGATRDEAEGLTKPQLIEQYGEAGQEDEGEVPVGNAAAPDTSTANPDGEGEES